MSSVQEVYEQYGVICNDTCTICAVCRVKE